MQPNPKPNSNPLPTGPFFSYFSQNPSSQFPLPQFPHVYTDPSVAAAAAAAITTSLAPPGAESYTTLNSSQDHTLSYVQANDAAYYLDPNLQNWAAKEAVLQYGADTAGYLGAAGVTMPQDGTQQKAIALPGSAEWANLTLQLQKNATWKNRQKKTKVVQSVYCEVCKVDCNSKEVLDHHKLGKKHKKNLEKLKEPPPAAGADGGPSASSGPCNPFIGPQKEPDKEKTGNVQKGKKKAAGAVEDLETKRRKIVEGGAAAEAVRVCSFCNVVCNSENVYKYHLTGRKHAAMLKKHRLRMATFAKI